MKTNIALPLLLFAGGACLLYAKVATDYDHAADFGRYHTYSWIKVQTEDPLWDSRIQAAIDSQLSAKGWQTVPSGGDTSLAAYGSAHNQRTLETWYNGFGGGWGWRRGWGGPGYATTAVENTPVGNLMVDVFDSQSKKLVWRGSSSESLSGKPDKNEKKLEKDVAEMFKHFPPPAKG